MTGLEHARTAVRGVVQVDLDVIPDDRGSFKEVFRRSAWNADGLPSLDIVQHNVSSNARVGVVRGIHAEPWAKYLSVAAGRVFAAIVDLRTGPDFGRLQTFDLTKASGLYIPEGCGTSFCTTEPHTVCSYLCAGEWSPNIDYLAVNPFDPAVGIPWPFPREQLICSVKDEAHPPLAAIRPVVPRWET